MLTGVKGIIFDIDGVLEFQGKVYPRAIEFVNMLREKGMILRFLTNSTLKSRKSCAEKLNKKGFQVSKEEIITASFATAAYLKELNPRSCWVMQEGDGFDEFRGFCQDTKNPEYIIIGDNRSKFDFDHLNHVLRLLLNGAKLIGMQEELTDTSLGEVELNVGSWTGMLERAARIKATYIGKPSSYVFKLALKTMELEKSEVIILGDRVSTDIKGANNFGIKSVLIKTGEFDERDIEGNIKPDYVFNSIGELMAKVEMEDKKKDLLNFCRICIKEE